MSELNVEQARFNMIEQQIRPWNVLDQRVLDIIATSPRERFVPSEYANMAFSDIEIPLAHGEVMMSPKLEGRLLQTLNIRPDDRILEIGTGSGYLTACLARLGGQVISVEMHADLSQSAQQQIAGLGIENVDFRVGDAGQGWGEDGEFDVIAITGSLPQMLPAFRQQMKVGGRMFAIIGESPIMTANLYTRINRNEWTVEPLFETELPALRNIAVAQKFIL